MDNNKPTEGPIIWSVVPPTKNNFIGPYRIIWIPVRSMVRPSANRPLVNGKEEWAFLAVDQSRIPQLVNIGPTILWYWG